MIRNQWYAVLNSREVKKNRLMGVTRLGEKLVLWRDQAGLHCIADQCAHRGASLCQGKLVEEQLQCPFHGFRYDGTGRVTLIPANGKNNPVGEQYRVHSYPVHEAQGFIWIWWGEGKPSPAEPPFFENIDGRLGYAEVPDPWHIHYSRVIENQLDVVHLPFVHHNTIGRGNRTVVDGPRVEWKDHDKFHLFVFNRVDDGRPPLKPSELGIRESAVHLEFIFPNLWQNYIAPVVRVIAFFVPVDEEHTILYLRFYAGFTPWKWLNTLFAWLAMPFNLIVAHQDRRIVQNQKPGASSYKMNEKLIPGDYPIVEYRRRRDELMKGVKK